MGSRDVPRNGITFTNRAIHAGSGPRSRGPTRAGPREGSARIARVLMSARTCSVPSRQLGERVGGRICAARQFLRCPHPGRTCRHGRPQENRGVQTQTGRTQFPVVRTSSTLDRPAVTPMTASSVHALRWSMPTAGSRSASTQVMAVRDLASATSSQSARLRSAGPRVSDGTTLGRNTSGRSSAVSSPRRRERRFDGHRRRRGRR